MQAFLEITGLKYVVGKDENGNDLGLSRVAFHRYDKDEEGNIGPDHNDEGTALFVGQISVAEAVAHFEKTNAPEWNIKVIVADGVEPVQA